MNSEISVTHINNNNDLIYIPAANANGIANTVARWASFAVVDEDSVLCR